MFALISVLFEDKIGPTPSGRVTLLIADRENNINDTAPMLSLFEDRILKPTKAGGAGRGEARRGGKPCDRATRRPRGLVLLSTQHFVQGSRSVDAQPAQSHHWYLLPTPKTSAAETKL